MYQHLSIHRVTSVELDSTYPENSGSRTIKIVAQGGIEFELTLYGATDALELLPKSDNFHRHYKHDQDAAISRAESTALSGQT